MAILKSTQINGDLTVTGSLNVQGDLTYVGVNNLRVKDHQIELNTNESGSSVVGTADKAGIVIRGARKTTQNVDDDASILYNSSDDTLVVNKTIKGTVSNATTAASANKVANILTVNVTDETGSLKTVEFDGSEVKTVDVNLQGLQNQINSLTGGAGSIATQINNAINNLDVADAAVVGQYVSSVSEANGKIAVTRAALPDYTEVYDAKGTAAAVKTELIGNNTDDKDSDTIEGAKRYADDLATKKADTVHTHAIADVTGLQAALDGKAAAVHTHAIANVTGLQAALDAKQDDLSADQLNAVNSGITKAKVDNYEAHVADTTTIHVSADDRKKWNAAEQNAKNYTNDEIKKLGLGNAAKKNVLEGAIADSPSSDNLVTAAQVKAYAAGVVGAMHFRGAFAENTVIADEITDPASGDVCLVGTKEYVYNGSAWVLFGDEGAYDIKGTAAQALKDAKSYADGLNTAMDTRVDALKSASHTHTNKAELDKIADGDKAKWDTHVSDADIHVTAEQKTTWSAKQDAFDNAAVLSAITSTQVSNWDDAFAKAHEHTNKAVLDGITADKVAAWDGAVSAAGVSSVGGKAGALTLKGGSATLGDVNLSISDTGEISAAIVPDSFDKKGDAATALANAKTYVDGKVDGKFDATGSAATAEQNAKTYADEKVSALSGSVATTDAAQDTKIANIEKSITSIQNSYVKKVGDTMTGDLTMPSSGNKGIVFGNMKIVWNSTDNAIEFVATA